VTVAGPGRKVACPICLNRVLWSQTPGVVINDRGDEVPLGADDDPAIGAWRSAAVRRCPGPGSVHYVPYRYGEFGEPIVVAIVGRTNVGKSALLAAMIAQLKDTARMDDAGLEVKPLDIRLDQSYHDKILRPFLERREQFGNTQPVASLDAVTYAAEVYSRPAGRSYAVVFVDVAGEDLTSVAENTIYLQEAGALLFVVDASELPPAGAPRHVPGDPTFAFVLGRLAEQHRAAGRFIPVPASIVVAKSDLLRFDPDTPVRRWFSYQDDDRQLNTVEDESEDVYAFLVSRGAGAYLDPAHKCFDVTLHFASATNCSPVGKEYPADLFRPRRVLKPLLALLAMKGLLGTDPFERHLAPGRVAS